MTDLELTKLCAEAMRYTRIQVRDSEIFVNGIEYNPLHNGAQVMALVRRFPKQTIAAMQEAYDTQYEASGAYLNYAIVECVAKIERGKSGTES